jgi:hypothetical protein
VKTHLSSQGRINEALTLLASIKPNGEYSIEIKRLPKSRTSLQNRALHKYCDLVAKELKAKNLTVQEVLSHGIERDFNMETVKAVLWKPLQKAVTGEEKTSKATTKYYAKVYKYLSHHLSLNFGITTAWPEDKTKEVKR